MPGHCRRGRICAPGDPFASRDNLQRLVEGLPVSIVALNRDRYGRIVALPTIGRLNLSCAQLQGGFAIYWRRYDAFKRLAKGCPAAR
jgi:endonuclease YncB( thermonuclease family)